MLSDNDLKSKSKIYVAEIDGEIIGRVVLFPGAIKAYDWSDSAQE